MAVSGATATTSSPGSARKAVTRPRLLAVVVLVPFFVDQLNGLLQKEFGVGFSISQWVKAVYMVPLLGYAVLEGLTAMAAIGALAIVLVLALASAQSCNSSAVHAVSVDFVFFGKLITFPLAYFGFVHLVKKREDAGRKLLATCANVLFLGIVAALVLSYFGFGDVNYGHAESGIPFGYKGYFIAGNEMSALFVLAYALALGEAIGRGPVVGLRPLAVVVLGLVASVLVFTKVALAGYVLTSVVVPVLARRGRATVGQRARRSPGAKAARAAAYAIAGLGAYLWAQERVQANVERLGENLAKAGDLAAFLFSGRLEYMADAWRMYVDGYSIPAKLLGCGWYWPEYLNTNAYSGSGSAEADHLDLLVSVGILGTAVVYAVWLLVLGRLVRAQRTHPTVTGAVVVYAFLTLFALGALSGHVMYSAMVGFYLALAAAVASTPGKGPDAAMAI